MSELRMEVSPSDLYLSIRGIQYAFHEALADLVDNSVDAEATNVWIVANKNEIIIADNGDGMSRDDLEIAITPWRAGDKSQKLRRGKRGKFGIGMKSASYSLGNCLEIHTKKKGERFECVRLDRDEIGEIKSPGHKFKTSNTITDLFKSYCKEETGTILRITKVNQRKVTSTAIDSLRNLLGLVYFSLIGEGDLKLMINNLPVKSLDPIMRGLKKNAPANHYEQFERKAITVEFEGTRAQFKISGAYVGRGNYWAEEDKNSYKYFLKRHATEDDSLKQGLLKLDEQGIYTLRNGRLITLGGWLGLASTNTLLHHNASTRVILEFDETGDDLMGLDNTKTILKVEEALKQELGKHIREYVSIGETLYRREGQKIKKAREKKKASDAIKEKKLRKESALAQSRMDEKRRKSNPGFDDRQGDLYDEQKKGGRESDEYIEIKDKLPYNNLWGYTENKENEILVFLNEQHPGYAALFLEDDEDKVRDNIKYLFYTLAIHEASLRELHADKKPAALDDLEEAFGAFRRWVSKHFTEF